MMNRTRAGSLNNLAITLPLLLPLSLLLPLLLPIKHGSLNNFPEALRETLEDHWHC